MTRRHVYFRVRPKTADWKMTGLHLRLLNVPGIQLIIMSLKLISAGVRATRFGPRPKAQLSVSGYGLDVFNSSASGAYSEDVPLKGPWSVEEVSRFMGQR